MSVNPSHLRPGNWIHRKGSSAYGIVNGKLLALLEEDEKERERFEGIEITPELLEAAGLKECRFEFSKGWFLCYDKVAKITFIQIDKDRMDLPLMKYLHQFQSFYEDYTGSELPLPESAKIINQAVEK